MYDAQVPCMCCNTMVLIRRQDWKETAAGLCMLCYKSVPFRVLLAIYSMRIQLGSFYNQLTGIQQQLNSGT